MRRFNRLFVAKSPKLRALPHEFSGVPRRCDRPRLDKKREAVTRRDNRKLLHECKERIASSGAVATIFNRARAGPVGWRRSCSQFCKVRTLTRSKRANSLWDNPTPSRMAFTSSGWRSNRREGSSLPPAIARASFKLCTKSSNSVVSISQPLDQLAQDRGFPVAQIVLPRLGINHQKIDLVPLLRPVVDHPHAAALAASPQREAQLANPPAAPDQIAALRVLQQLVLQRPVLLVQQQRRDQAGEGGGLDEFHRRTICAIGVQINPSANPAGAAERSRGPESRKNGPMARDVANLGGKHRPRPKAHQNGFWVVLWASARGVWGRTGP